MSVEDANVEVIEHCLNTPPDEHRVECEEEWWLPELGEQPALYLAQATVNGSPWADLLAWMAWQYRIKEFVRALIKPTDAPPSSEGRAPRA